MDKLGDFYVKEYLKNKNKYDLRKKEIELTAEALEKQLKKTISQEINLVYSVERLDTAVISFAYDIIRYKSFHGMLDENKNSLVNFPKIYAFMTKWIIREKPFTLGINNIDSIENNTDLIEIYTKNSNIINELISLTWIEYSFRANYKGKKLQVISQKNNNSYIDDSLIYILKYRDFSTGLFEYILDLYFENALK